MNVVVDAVETQKTITITKRRVQVTLDEQEATVLKLALEFLRNPEMYNFEAEDERLFSEVEINSMISVLERANVFYDGVYLD